VSDPWPIAFYAPLKSPRHAVPSGDRTMARLLMNALERAGCCVDLASELRTLDLAGDPNVQARLRDQALGEADRLVAKYRRRPPELRLRGWFSYHVYYKAPDWIGPRVADALAIPYLVAEASRAHKRANGPWALGHAGAEAALDRADVIFSMTAADREALEWGKPERQRLVDLPPFLDLEALAAPESGPERPAAVEATRLLTVAMMRPGDKLASYRLLAEALGGIVDEAWTLDIVGDGEAHAEVVGLFSAFRNRVRFHGTIDDPARLASLYSAADLLVWPAVNEAYGMALLEAQAFGCPVVAGDEGGVCSAVRAGESGVLTPRREVGAFARAVQALIRDTQRRQALGEGARRFVRAERGLDGAAARLRAAMLPLLKGWARCGS
jgi:glycosyltransferase involved in cell wall biosynthesis